MRIRNNLAAMYASSNIKKTQNRLINSTERLSSGFKINRAADDAAGLSISEKLRSQIRGLQKAQKNIQDGMSYCNVADGALNEVHSILDRIKELSVQAASDTYTDEDRKIIDAELQQLNKEVNTIFKDTEFNTVKIWQEAYVPDTGGNAKDFELYNVKDSAGSYYGGISYMSHRYSWQDLGIGWDDSTKTFTQDKVYNINSSILINDGSSTDDDIFTNAHFTLVTTAGTGPEKIKKTYDWSADNSGIYIDGVQTRGRNSHEGNTTWAAMGLTAGQHVDGGDYSFEYYGTEVSFSVPDGGDDWDDFLSGINNSLMNLDWHSVESGAYAKQVINGTNTIDRININSTNKNYIANDNYAYTIKADETGVWMANGASAASTFAKNSGIATFKSWESLGIKSWGIDVNGNPNSKTDSMPSAGADNNSGAYYVTLGTDDYTYNNRDFYFTFEIDKQGSRAAVISDLNNTTYSNLGIVAPTSLTASVASSSSGKFGMTGRFAKVSFLTQRDNLGRAFASSNESIGNGVLSEEAGKYVMTFNGGYRMTSIKDSTEFKNDLKQAIMEKKYTLERSLNSTAVPPQTVDPSASLGLGSYSLQFRNGSDSVGITINLNNLTYGDTNDIDALIADSMSRVMNDSTINIRADGQAYQNIRINQNNVLEKTTMNSTVVDGFKLTLNIQAGASSNDFVPINYDYMRLGTIGMKGTNVLTRDSAELTLTAVDKAIDKVSEQRSVFGAATNRLEHALKVNQINEENMQAAESRIRDTDIAKEMMEYTKNNILLQIGQSIMAQANQNASGVLQLLG